MIFPERFKNFLLELRDDYGFTIPVDRLKSALTCAEDFTDVREVCFRVQSMICGSEEEIKTFQSLFAQTFLGKVPVSKPKKEISEEEKKRISEIYVGISDDKLDRQRENLEISKRGKEEKIAEVKQRKKESEEKNGELRRLKFEAEDRLEKLVKLLREKEKNVDNRRGVVSVNPNEESLFKDITELKEKLASIEKIGYNTKKFKDVINKSNNLFEKTSKEDYMSLINRIKSDLMDAAKQARNSSRNDVFSTLIKSADLISHIKKDALKCTDEKKEELSGMKSECTELRRKIKEERAELNELNEQILKNSKKIDEDTETLNQLRQEVSKSKKTIDTMAKELENRKEKQIIKDRSASHRAEFLEGIQSVKTTEETAELMKTNLNSVSAQEKEKILSYIRANAKEFRQTLRKLGTTYQRRKIDIKETVKAARKTDGEPLIIKYKEPKKSHARVLTLVDLSGSCRDASTLSLYFMAMMDEAFPGGCKKFAFVNSLNPVDKYFAYQTPDEGVKNVTENIKTRGVYSDYGKTIHEFKEFCSGDFRKDTTIIILGDARNNSNGSNAEEFKWIADRCRKIYWLNTENETMWNTGDSILYKYKNAGAEVCHVETVGDLIEFLSNIQIV